jgi:hypothetical protein
VLPFFGGLREMANAIEAPDRRQLHPNYRTFQEKAETSEMGQELPHAVQRPLERREAPFHYHLRRDRLR